MAIGLGDFRPHIDAGTTRIRFADPNAQPAQRQVAGQGAMGNRVAEWFRGQGASAKAENSEVTKVFIQAVGREHGLDAALQIGHRLQARIDAGKPLTARVVAVMSREAAQIEASAKSNNAAQAKALLDRPSGHAGGVTALLTSAAANIGITDRAILDKLSDPTAGQAEVRQRIERAVSNAKDDLGKPRMLTPDAALAIAKKEIDSYLVAESNKQAFGRVNTRVVDGMFAPGPGGAPSFMARHAQEYADVTGLESIRHIFDDPTSARAQQAKDALSSYMASQGRVFTPDQAAALVSLKGFNEVILDSAIAAGNFDGLRLPPQPDISGLTFEFSSKIRARVFADSTPPATQEAFAKAMVAESVRVAHSPDPSDQSLAQGILIDLTGSPGYDLLPSEDRRTVLTAYRDGLVQEGGRKHEAYADLLKAATQPAAARSEAAGLRADAQGARAEAHTAREAGDMAAARLHELRVQHLEGRAKRLESTPNKPELENARKEAEARPLGAMTTQADLVALALKDLEASGTPTTGRRIADLVDEANRKGMPQLQSALEGVERIEREYAGLKGPNGHELAGASSENRMQLAELRARALELGGDEGTGAEQQAFIASGMRKLTATMIDRAVQVLGPPPVPFAAVSLGSTSRGEASPFSDVEFGIVLQQPTDDAGKEYMQRLAELVRFQVYGLGEAGGSETPLGLHWDTGGNTPAESPGSFIGTADQLVAGSLAHRLDHAGQPEPANVFTFTMFSNTEWLYGADGSWDIVKDMNNKVAAEISATPPGAGQSNGQALGGWLLREALIAPLGDLPSRLLEDGATEVNVKNLSRLPMMLAHGLSLTSDAHSQTLGQDQQGQDVSISAHSTLMRLDALKEKGILSEAEANTLQDAFSELGRIRNQAHLTAGMGDDRVNVDDYPTLPGVIAALAPFEERLRAHVDNPGQPF